MCDVRGTSRVTNELVQSHGRTSLEVALCVVTDPRNVESRSNVKTHGYNEQSKVSSTDLGDRGEENVSNEVERHAKNYEWASYPVLVAIVGDNHEKRPADKLDWDSEEVRFHVGESHRPDNLWHEGRNTVKSNVGAELDRSSGVDLTSQ